MATFEFELDTILCKDIRRFFVFVDSWGSAAYSQRDAQVLAFPESFVIQSVTLRVYSENPMFALMALITSPAPFPKFVTEPDERFSQYLCLNEYR